VPCVKSGTLPYTCINNELYIQRKKIQWIMEGWSYSIGLNRTERTCVDFDDDDEDY
jgi:hypothetical protein